MVGNSEVKLAVTGGSGFIARGVLETCAAHGLPCRALSRSPRPPWAVPAVEWSTIASYGDAGALEAAIAGARHVLHLADNPVRADARGEEEAVRNAAALIDAMRRSGAERAVLASSVYARDELGAGATAYGAAKRAVEARFLAAAGLRTVILRLPPVYGPGGRGGLAALSGLVRKGLPLPLGLATAPRSYLSRRNLASLIVAIVNGGEQRWTGAAGRIFEPSDGAGVGTRDLVRHMASEIGVAPRLLPVPLWLLRSLATVIGKDLVSAAVDRLDVAPVEALEDHFGWRPVEAMPASLAFLAEESTRA